MRVNTTLPDAGIVFDGTESNQRGDNTCEENNTTHLDKIKLSGNKCGHNPNKFRDYEPSTPLKRRPPLIQKIIRKLEKLQLFHRSERRESIILALKCIADYTDLITGHCWDGFKLLSLVDIAKKTGLELRRLQRVVRELKLVGYLTVSERYKALDEDSLRAIVAIKKLTPKLFFVLGISHAEIEAERHKAIKRKETKRFYASKTINRASGSDEIARHALSYMQKKLK